MDLRRRWKNSRRILWPVLVLAGMLSLCPAAAFSAQSVVPDAVSRRDGTLPEYFNLARQGRKPQVRSQGNTGTCWALCAVTAMESALLPQDRRCFSADHMSLRNGFHGTQEDGGDYYMIMSYLADWKGPVLEEEDPYGDEVSPEGLSAACHVQEIRLLQNASRETAKQMILTYGALQSSLCMDRARTDTDEYHYYNALTSAYFDPLMENVDHDIIILGWDDAFSRDNFRVRPREDGAWICQNTWGESFGEDGVFYVSYEDRNLLRRGGVVYSRIESTDNYDRVYENDSLGWQGRQGYEGYESWFAGAYTAAGGEELRAVGLYSTGPGTVCEVYVIPRFAGEQDLENVSEQVRTMHQSGSRQQADEADPEETDRDETGRDEGEQTDTGQDASVQYVGSAAMDTAGYFTIELDRAVPLAAGQEFAVVVWIRTEGETRPVAVEMVKDSFTTPVTLEGRRTWISRDGAAWDRTQEVYQTNVCLKAYTKLS